MLSDDYIEKEYNRLTSLMKSAEKPKWTKEQIERYRMAANMVQESPEVFVPVTVKAMATRFIDALDEITRLNHTAVFPILSIEEVKALNGEMINIHYIGSCTEYIKDVTAPYYGKYEQYIQEYNGMLRPCDLRLQYYGKQWFASRIEA